eukprot:GHVR01149285.1.p1 GENE.GHVR01149285.1~~GHVR01149285.1.p1  ORF type:complete len:366 (-),score=69.88 GHVR01149285.1:653-1750(-)
MFSRPVTPAATPSKPTRKDILRNMSGCAPDRQVPAMRYVPKQKQPQRGCSEARASSSGHQAGKDQIHEKVGGNKNITPNKTKSEGEKPLYLDQVGSFVGQGKALLQNEEFVSVMNKVNSNENDLKEDGPKTKAFLTIANTDVDSLTVTPKLQQDGYKRHENSDELEAESQETIEYKKNMNENSINLQKDKIVESEETIELINHSTIIKETQYDTHVPTVVYITPTDKTKKLDEEEEVLIETEDEDEKKIDNLNLTENNCAGEGEINYNIPLSNLITQVKIDSKVVLRSTCSSHKEFQPRPYSSRYEDANDYGQYDDDRGYCSETKHIFRRGKIGGKDMIYFSGMYATCNRILWSSAYPNAACIRL